MMLFAGADLVLRDRVLLHGSLIVDDDRIVAVEEGAIATPAGATRVDLSGLLVVPGFVDVHVHGVEGDDTLDAPDVVRRIARRLPRYGVTAFCPTSVACAPHTLRQFLAGLAAARVTVAPHSARVLPAHLESNFINPEYVGAQPMNCVRRPDAQRVGAAGAVFSGEDVLAVMREWSSQIAIVTLAPEIEGGLDLVRALAQAGHRVSIGHSGATYDQALAAIDAGVSHATHLFNRMSPMTHRAPGVPGAVLQSDAVAVEVICDGFHVHPSLLALAVRSKGAAGTMAITDGTAGSGLPVGSRALLGGRSIVVTEKTATLDDGTLAGSVLTMDGAFRTLVRQAGTSVVDAARMCATTPAEQLGLADTGRIAPGAVADLVVLDRELRVHATYVRGRIWRNTNEAENV
jgi:N-acetylglucosamine-6-phosphate deacetylase